MRIRLMAAIAAAKITHYLSKTMGGRGSSLPGLIALRVFPGTLEALVRQVPCTVLVTGTNGKTTTNNMLAGVLESSGLRVIVNREGANLITGVTAAFVRAAGIGGRLKHDAALLEVDEAAFPRVAELVKPKVVIVTNFFRDQLDRYGELDKTVSFIKTTLQKIPAVRLVLNADDPLVAQLADVGRPFIFYGLGNRIRGEEVQTPTREARFCPLCGEEFIYAYYHYSQLGAFRCPGCGFARPPADVEAHTVIAKKHITHCGIRVKDSITQVTLPTSGFYNVYNALAVMGAGLWLGVEPDRVSASLMTYVPAVGRLQRFVYKGRPVYLNLVKNPAGFNESLNLICSSEPKDVMIALNDNHADGRDISWIWDVDFETLERQKQILSYICSGKRAEEMALRLKYAGVPIGRIEVHPNIKSGVRRVLEGMGSVVYLLATYTALWPVDKVLRRHAMEVADADRLSSLPRPS